MTNTLLIGKSKELVIASQFTEHGLLVFFPFVDIGADLIVSGEAMKRFLPVQVKYNRKAPALGLEKNYIKRLSGIKMILVFIIGSGSNEGTWYIPLNEFEKHTKDRDRKDKVVYITIRDNREWLERFKGENGLQLIKKQLEK